ncbi:hypothetical protein HETIRDRAFT_313187 [Heterobasidion irregulare TC 32-1]|uniref:Uncharacterized protein n=1 Tax=Heterobasidion irregulare (strain TC 32-1) TaxID=747525 RepID=W4KCN4_HETIT|nr:uncharacterized protein HETIRDRAFT_313187 [Heterobasidion irregulare TC 32-1]ETW83543.1 hypothetical protein HETIRDRAFT_313187 [Heterobasidion irregulare TC 32-1]
MWPRLCDAHVPPQFLRIHVSITMSATLDHQILSSGSTIPCKRTPSRSDSDTVQVAPEELPSFTTLLAEGKVFEVHDEFDASQSDLSASQSTVVEDDEDEVDQLNASQYIMTQPAVPEHQGVDQTQTQSDPSKEEPQIIQSSIPSPDNRNVEIHPPFRQNVACLVEGPYYANDISPQRDETRRHFQQNVASSVEGPDHANGILPRDETPRVNYYTNAEGSRSRKSRHVVQPSPWKCPPYRLCQWSAHSGEDPHEHAARCGCLSRMRSEHLLRISARLRAPEAAVTPARPNEDPDFKRWCEDLLNHNGQTIAPSNRALLLAAFNKGLEFGSRRTSAIHQMLRAEATSAIPRTQLSTFNPGHQSGIRPLVYYPQTSTGPYHVPSGMPTPSSPSGSLPRTMRVARTRPQRTFDPLYRV